jgi:phage baseplate assembly protein W
MKALMFPFRLDPRGVFAATTNYNEIVRGQVIDALMTNLGERQYRPRYGCDIQAALFDPTDELVRADTASIIKSRLEQLVTRALIRNVSIAEGTPGTVVITIVYRASLYATDTTVAVPVASEFLNRQQAITQGAV